MSSNHVCSGKTFVEFHKKEIEQSISNRFQKIVNTHSQRVALKHNNHELTYSALNNASNHMAQSILEKRGPEAEPVALLFEQGSQLITAILAVLKAGKFYVPLDPSYPITRNSYFLKDSESALIITNNKNISLAKKLASHEHQVVNFDEIDLSSTCQNINLAISPDTPSYILYTSGSTGQPKGVVQNHQNVLHNIMKYTNGVHICADDRLSLLSSCSVGASVSNLFGALLNGATLYPFDLKAEGLGKLSKLLIQEGITIYHSVPTVFRHFVSTFNGDEIFTKLRLIKLGGESVNVRDVELYQQYFSDNCIFHVGLGSTEMNIIRQYFINKKTQLVDNIVPVGYEVADTEILILDEKGERSKCNQIGEITIRSRYLSPGYWRKPELNQTAFLTDSINPELRVYRTGDLGRLRADGCLEHLGRKDFQVKIRGHRIEAGEVEKALLDLGMFEEAVVTARTDQSNEQSLVAYLTGNTQVKTKELRKVLKEILPDYMIPKAFVMLKKMPLTNSGKIDRHKLPVPEEKDLLIHPTPSEASNPLEQELIKIWKSVLKVKAVGVDDNFVDLGGDSLSTLVLLEEIHKVTGHELTLAALIQAPTIAQQAETLKNLGKEKNYVSLVALQKEGSKPPLFLVPPLGGTGIGFRKIAHYLGEQDQPVYGFTPVGIDGKTPPHKDIPEMAAHYIHEMQMMQPEGPYRIGGMCMGGMVAWEMAQQLTQQQCVVDCILLLDSGSPSNGLNWNWIEKPLPKKTPKYLLQRILYHKKHKTLWISMISPRLRKIKRLYDKRYRNFEFIKETQRQALHDYHAKPLFCKILFLQSDEGERALILDHWKTIILGPLEHFIIPSSTHISLLRSNTTHTKKMVKFIKNYLDKLDNTNTDIHS